MGLNNFLKKLVLLVLSLALYHCASFKSPVPDGFAPYKGKKVFRAASPDGVNFRVRTVKNKPYAEISFWKEALQNRMVDAGYTLVESRSIETDSKKGEILELAAPFGSEDYSYLIAIFLKKDEIIVVESSGEVGKFQKRKPDIMEAIKKMEL